ncbi:hypothetical protein NPIL_409821, partial [Nephila pilipes]
IWLMCPARYLANLYSTIELVQIDPKAIKDTCSTNTKRALLRKRLVI